MDSESSNIPLNNVTINPISDMIISDELEIFSYDRKLCPSPLANDYILCLDNWRAIKNIRSRRHIKHRERHFLVPSTRCLIPLSDDYKLSVLWPKCRDMGNSIMVILDVGCGVASFSGYLLNKNVITMSFAPKDEHEAHIQFTLEHGIFATLSIITTKKLVFLDNAYDMIHCTRYMVHWHADGGKPLMDLNRVLRPGGYTPLDSCLLPSSLSDYEWPAPWPQRLNIKPLSLLLEADAEQIFNEDTRHLAALVSDMYLRGLAINWSGVRNVIDMNEGYGGCDLVDIAVETDRMDRCWACALHRLLLTSVVIVRKVKHEAKSKARVDQFLNLCQRNISVREYNLWFNSLARYAPNVVTTMDDRAHRYMDILDPYLFRYFTIAALNKDIDIARIQDFAQKIEDRRQRRRTQELVIGYSKRARSMGYFMASQEELRPQFSNRLSRPLSSYSAASASLLFQGSKGNQFRERSES
ncbi:putative methyltransferase PMT25 [Capsicum chinense]|nr:putative methyltransferase PMT25 [Capsicum chinense]